jgi:hypothetical protein
MSIKRRRQIVRENRRGGFSHDPTKIFNPARIIYRNRSSPVDRRRRRSKSVAVKNAQIFTKVKVVIIRQGKNRKIA